jgi:hypothetical protein
MNIFFKLLLFIKVLRQEYISATVNREKIEMDIKKE